MAIIYTRHTNLATIDKNGIIYVAWCKKDSDGQDSKPFSLNIDSSELEGDELTTYNDFMTLIQTKIDAV